MFDVRHKFTLIEYCRHVVEEANKIAPPFSQISKDRIIVTVADRPMERTGKGTVAKKATLKAYTVELDVL